MPGNAFLKFKEITKGESFQAGHHGDEGWIEIGDWSWDIESETSFLKGGGSAVGKAVPGTLTISHFYDLSSPVILSKAVAGTAFANVTIDMLKQVGAADGKPKVFFQIQMKDVFIAKVSTKGGEDGTINQDVDMVCKEIVVGYKAQNNDGTLEGSSIDFGWNVSKMNFVTDVQVKMP